MTAIQEQAIEIIKQLPDYKVEALLMFASDELELKKLRQQRKKERSTKQAAFEKNRVAG